MHDAAEGGSAMRKEKMWVFCFCIYKYELNQEDEGTEMRMVSCSSFKSRFLPPKLYAICVFQSPVCIKKKKKLPYRKTRIFAKQQISAHFET